jgi:hypothetical protein
VHPFWLFHEEKRPWLELSRGAAMTGVGVPWSAMGFSSERGQRGNGRGRGGAARGHGWATPVGGGVQGALGAIGGARPTRVVLCP